MMLQLHITPRSPAPAADYKWPLSRLCRILAYVLAIGLLISLLPSTVRIAARQISTAIAEYQAKIPVVPQTIETGTAWVRSKTAPGAPIVFLARRDLDGWVFGLWQRALYPNPVFLIYDDQIKTGDYQKLRQLHRIQFALSVGHPPVDPGFAWSEPVPGVENSGEVVFGAIR